MLTCNIKASISITNYSVERVTPNPPLVKVPLRGGRHSWELRVYSRERHVQMGGQKEVAMRGEKY